MTNEWIVEQWTPDGHVWRQVEGPFVSRTLAISRRDRRQRSDATRRFRVPDKPKTPKSTMTVLAESLRKVYGVKYFERMQEQTTPLLLALGMKKG
jgi:hypothetical protein